jgi:hypothetical protein
VTDEVFPPHRQEKREEELKKQIDALQHEMREMRQLLKTTNGQEGSDQ